MAVVGVAYICKLLKKEKHKKLQNQSQSSSGETESPQFWHMRHTSSTATPLEHLTGHLCEKKTVTLFASFHCLAVTRLAQQEHFSRFSSLRQIRVNIRHMLWHLDWYKTSNIKWYLIIRHADPLKLLMCLNTVKEDNYINTISNFVVYNTTAKRDNISDGNLLHRNEPRHEKMCLRESPTRQDANWPAQLQRSPKILKFRVYKLEVLYYLGSERQRRWSDCADARLCCVQMA